MSDAIARDSEASGAGESEDTLATLVVCAGPDAGRNFPLVRGNYTLGRAGAADLVFADPDISRVHARLEVHEFGVELSDLGSKNGVSVGGVALEGSTRLGDGARFELGATEVEVSHPGARVGDVLRRGGEATVTVTRTRVEAEAEPVSLRGPLLGLLGFGLLALLLSFL